MVVILDTCFLTSYFAEGKSEAVEIFDRLFKNKNSRKEFGEIFLFDYILDEFISNIIGKTKRKDEILIFEAQLKQLIDCNQLTLIYTNKDLFNISLDSFRTHKNYCASLTDEILINYFNKNVKPLAKSIPKHIISFDSHFKRGDLLPFLNLKSCT